ncbi:MAG: hypothetical protein HY550_02920 [Elusimicrobia bacterium]|nr:hypothetical protein [Elusimicrobiota bacterium]
MKTASCPNCGGKRVRTGKTFLPHLARMAVGSRRRYCRNCRSRWIGEEKLYSPWARLALILLVCGPAIITLVYLKREGWFEPQPYLYETADAEHAAAGAHGGSGIDGGVEALLEGDMAGVYAQRFAGTHFAERSRRPVQWRTGQLDMNTLYNLTLQGGMRPAGQSREMQEMLSRMAEAVKRTGKTPQELAREIDQTDKQTLWDKYGNNFASKDEAKAAHNEFKANRGKIPY